MSGDDQVRRHVPERVIDLATWKFRNFGYKDSILHLSTYKEEVS